MPEDEKFKNQVKESFSRVREDINILRNELNTLKSEVSDEINTLRSIKSELRLLISEFFKNAQNSPNQEVSTGNQGVFTNKQTNKHTHLQTNKQTNALKTAKLAKTEILDHFKSLTKREFYLFLLIYQLEEDLNRPIFYSDLVREMNVSNACIRVHVSSLLLKNAPIIKEKINNKIVTLTIEPDFRLLNIKNELSSLFYQIDSDQTKLF